jgi:copper resistance protein D
MEFDLQLAMYAATAVLNLTLALATGAALGALWLARGSSGWATAQLSGVRRTRSIAVGAAIALNTLLLWLASAAMAEVPISQAGEAVWTMLTATHVGLAWMIGMTALLATLVASVLRKPPAQLCLLGLAVFLYTRGMTSHAATEGDFSVAMLANWIHLMFICIWVGEVLIAGLFTLGKPLGTGEADLTEAARYIEALSTTATVALAGIVVTGVYSAWRNLGSPSAIIDSPYGTALLIKLAIVGLAVALGGFNRFIVMPGLLESLRKETSPADSGIARFTLILRIEAVVLLGVLAVAAVLSATSPPAAL